MNGAGTAYETRTPAQVLSDIGAQPAGNYQPAGSYAALNGSTSAQFVASGFLAAEGTSGFNGTMGYSFVGDGAYDTGMFSQGDGYINFVTNGAQAAYANPNAVFTFPNPPWSPAYVATNTNGFRFSGSSGYFYMDANNGAVRVPAGGQLFLQDVNQSAVTVNVGALNASGYVNANDGMLYFPSGGEIQWNGNYSNMNFQTDNNVVVYVGGAAKWATNTGTSDARLKENIEDTSAGGLGTISRLRVVDFSWRPETPLADGGERHTGFIAQEVAEVVPEAVVDAGPNLIVHRDMIVPYLVKALQELHAEVESLRTQLQDTHT